MAGRVYVWTPERRGDVEVALRQSSTRAEAARSLGVSLPQIEHACERYGIRASDLLGKGESLTVQAPPPLGLTGQELIEERKRRFARRAAHEEAKALIPVRVDGDQPIGLLGMGDLHLDDDGTDVGLVEEHARLVRDTPGLYGFTPGDVLNNWIGRLSALHAKQGITQSEGWSLVEWYVDLVRDWLFLVLGNHDVWAGSGSSSPMHWITQRAGVYSAEHDVRVALRFTNGRTVRMHIRHDFPGHSMWNETHALLRAATMGHRDHVLVAGHRHTSGYQVIADPDTGIAMHLVRLAGYKVHDEYASEKGYLKRSLGPAAVLVIDPRLDEAHPDLVKVFHDPREGASYLKWRRSRRAA
jgi:hypothetical protein